MKPRTAPQGILTSQEILQYVLEKKLVFDPRLDKFQVQVHSVDLRLGFTFLIPKYWQMTLYGREAIQSDHTQSQDTFNVIELELGQFFEILPHEYVVFSSLEKIMLPKDLMAILYPRSSVNRRGLSVDLSGVIDAGYEGHLIIPVRNNTHAQTIRVYPGERFCQIVFHVLGEEVEPKMSRFHGKDVAATFGGRSGKSSEEIDLVRSGQLRELKEKFGVN